MIGSDKRFVAIIVPVLNEERDLERVIRSLATQSEDIVAEIMVADGGSSDASPDIVRRLSDSDARIRLIDNPGRTQSAAVNLCARLALPQVRVFVRADAHAEYSADFVERLVAAWAQTGAQSVVNRLYSRGVGKFQRAVAAVSNSRFGTGGAVHRSGGVSDYVEHGHHALFEADTFRALGGYDESFLTNEDAEYDTRLRAAGGRIWFTASADVVYFPRDTLGGVIRQYYRYGMGRAATRAKHGERLKARQMIPPALVVGLGFALMATPLTPWALAPWAFYLGGVCAATMLLVARSRDICVSAAALVLPAMHLSWGAGFLVGLVLGRTRRHLPSERNDLTALS